MTIKISQLPSATPLDETELVPIVQGGVTKQTLISKLLAAITGAFNVGADDANSGTLFTTVQGFITYLLSSLGSSIVGFIQAGTGAVRRLLQAKVREIQVSVADFGAVGDGTTDDRAAGQAGIDYLSGLGGGVLVIPQNFNLHIGSNHPTKTFMTPGDDGTSWDGINVAAETVYTIPV